MTIELVTAAQRLAETKRKISMVVAGRAKVGKTSRLGSLPLKVAGAVTPFRCARGSTRPMSRACSAARTPRRRRTRHFPKRITTTL